MIRQHYLQQQRLQSNHERLLERYHNILTPKISEFRTFGTSSLPGRNYEQYVGTLSSNPQRKDSLVALSRAGIGSSDNTYRWLDKKTAESLPKHIQSIVTHSREQPMPLVRAEKFEPVQVYEHPLFGLTPAYIKPIYNEDKFSHDTNNNYDDKDSSDNDDSDDDNEVRSRTSNDVSSRNDHNEDRLSSAASIKNDEHDSDDDDDYDNNAPRGYISYKKWKKKIASLIPVNPLLFHIYTQRPNGSLNSYGQSLYSSLSRPKLHRPSGHDEDADTPTISDTASVTSEVHQPSSASTQRYHKLQLSPTSRPAALRSLPPLTTGGDSESSDDESSPPDSPVPYLSRSKLAPAKPTSFFGANPTTSTITPSFSTPATVPSSTAAEITTTIAPSTLNPTATLSSTSPSMNTSNIPAAPPLPLSLTNGSNVPPAPPLPSSLPNTSNIPPAPPLPSSLSAASTHSYQTPSSISISSPPTAPLVPKPLSTSSSTATYQVPSTSSILDASTTASQPKAVTFGGSSSFPAKNDDISSSSDSDDDEKQKRRRQKKRQAAAGMGGDVDSSSSDD